MCLFVSKVGVPVCKQGECVCLCMHELLDALCVLSVGVSLCTRMWVCPYHQCMCGCVECLLMLLNVSSCNWPDMGLRHTSCPPHQAGG